MAKFFKIITQVISTGADTEDDQPSKLERYRAGVPAKEQKVSIP